MQGKVSMVVPCYNKENYIGAMLESVYEQIWDNIEVILVNDGSTDKTRDIIEEWTPVLQSRGYEVVIIDQKNSGCCAAVLSGLTRMTGDYFCLVDCDDEILPEYVSRMAGWLDVNGDYEWAACSYQPFVHDGKEEAALPPAKHTERQDTKNLLEKHILRRVITTVWIYMVRVDYLNRCRVIENFCAERRATYEPPIIVPLAAGGGKLKFFDEPLYKYNRFASDMYYFDRFAKVEKYYGDYMYLYNWSIDRLPVSDAAKRRLCAIARLANRKDTLYHLNGKDAAGQKMIDRETHLYTYAEETAKLADSLFSPPPCFAPESFMGDGYRDIFSLFEKIILGGKLEFFANENTRIIGYGALGREARACIPGLIGTPAEPHALWDMAADGTCSVCGIPVQRPVFDSLEKNDVLLVFPQSHDIIEFVKSKCPRNEVVAAWNVIRYKYPEIKNECGFIFA